MSSVDQRPETPELQEYVLAADDPDRRRRKVRFVGAVAHRSPEFYGTYTIVYVTKQEQVAEEVKTGPWTSIRVYESFEEFEEAQPDSEEERTKDMLADVAAKLGREWIEEIA